jgi:hypothetical protein
MILKVLFDEWLAARMSWSPRRCSLTVEEAKISACQGDEAQENDF